MGGVSPLKIMVKLFANLRDQREKEQILTLPEGANPGQVMAVLHIAAEDVAIIMINGRRTEADAVLQEGDTLALFPPVGGG